MRRWTFGIALATLLALVGFGFNAARAQTGDATPVASGSPTAESPVITPAASPATVATGSVVLTFVERATTDTVIDNGDEGDSIGDLLAFGNEVFDADNAVKVGDDQGWCVRTTAGVAWECSWTLILDDGQIVVQGPFNDASDSVLAITGGTGAYVGVSGQMRLSALSETEFQFVYELR